VVFIYSFLLGLVHLIELPTLNLDSVGQLGFIGDYAGLSPFKTERQFEQLSSDSQSGILLKNHDDTFELLYSIQGTIETSCQLNDQQVVLAGSFEYNNTFHNIVQLDTNSLQLTPINGIDGSVYALYCDSDRIYIGGNFNNSALIYQNNQLLPLPWKGFNGPVYTITKNPFTNSILFGGQFDSTGDGQYFNGRTSQSINLATSAVSPFFYFYIYIFIYIITTR
jgi:hypothetical protein